jgi:hypothetical protein
LPTSILLKEQVGTKGEGGKGRLGVVQGTEHELVVVGFDEEVLFSHLGEALFFYVCVYVRVGEWVCRWVRVMGAVRHVFLLLTLMACANVLILDCLIVTSIFFSLLLLGLGVGDVDGLSSLCV